MHCNAQMVKACWIFSGLFAFLGIFTEISVKLYLLNAVLVHPKPIHFS